MAVRISRAVLEAIISDASTTPTVERCGLLLGSADHVTAWLSVANVHPDPDQHFELDPATLIAVERAARQGHGPGVAGHYHSHPKGSAVPSLADAEAAAPDGRLWLLTAQGECRLWRSVAAMPLANDGTGALWLSRFVEEEIDVTD